MSSSRAYFFDAPEENEGRAFVYHGSPSGLAAGAGLGRRERPGRSASSATGSPPGDLNGDGFTDIIVGAHEYDNGEVDEGILYVFHGSSAGSRDGPAVDRGSQPGRCLLRGFAGLRGHQR